MKTAVSADERVHAKLETGVVGERLETSDIMPAFNTGQSAFCPALGGNVAVSVTEKEAGDSCAAGEEGGRGEGGWLGGDGGGGSGGGGVGGTGGGLGPGGGEGGQEGKVPGARSAVAKEA